MDSLECRYVYSGRIHAAAGSSFRPHSHNVHEVVVVHRGRLAARIGGRSAVAEPGQILWYGIDERHYESVVGRTSCDWHYLLFAGPPVPDGHALLVADTNGHLRQLTAMISSGSGKSDTLHIRQRDALCTALLAEFAILQVPGRMCDDGMVGSVLNYITRHLSQPLDLSRLAMVAGLSRAHFARTFRKHAGMTVMTAVRNARLARARELLLTSDLTLAAIADQVGLGSQPLLSRSLARYLGIGARTLRRGHRHIGLTT